MASFGDDAFSADITGVIDAEGPQGITVAVHSPVDAINVPVGKQRSTPEGIFNTASSGIWQTVWLEPVADVSIAHLVLTYETNTGALLNVASAYGISGSIYTQLTDVETEQNGFFTYDRRV